MLLTGSGYFPVVSHCERKKARNFLDLEVYDFFKGLCSTSWCLNGQQYRGEETTSGIALECCVTLRHRLN